ncbi:TolC family protein [candidate division KSB1 bacterium]|nr:TolC family protein [candidate division KSB1 bacterium]
MEIFIPGKSHHNNQSSDRYIQQALDSNLALQQADFSYQKSIAALREARGLFLPGVDIQARYSRADGGRLIEFPVGDMLNYDYFIKKAVLEKAAATFALPNKQ